MSYRDFNHEKREKYDEVFISTNQLNQY